MGHEINRIANATNFNGIKLLDGSRSGGHDGSGLNSTGAVKIHFGTGNDSAEDYYYLSFGNATLRALDLVEGGKAGIIFSLGDMPGATDTGYKATSVGSGLISMSYIPKGAKGVEIIIDGLPGEDRDMMLETAKTLGQLDIQSIKIHLLHVLKGTALAQMYERGEFRALEMDEYVNIVCDQLELLPAEIVIQRVTGDGAKDDLVAPLWSLKKFCVMNEIDKEMGRRNSWQGKALSE